MVSKLQRIQSPQYFHFAIKIVAGAFVVESWLELRSGIFESLLGGGRASALSPEAVISGVECVTYRSSYHCSSLPPAIVMDPNQNAKFPLHEAAREGKSKWSLSIGLA